MNTDTTNDADERIAAMTTEQKRSAARGLGRYHFRCGRSRRAAVEMVSEKFPGLDGFAWFVKAGWHDEKADYEADADLDEDGNLLN